MSQPNFQLQLPVFLSFVSIEPEHVKIEIIVVCDMVLVSAAHSKWAKCDKWVCILVQIVVTFPQISSR
jgi:hypothetical protein